MKPGLIIPVMLSKRFSKTMISELGKTRTVKTNSLNIILLIVFFSLKAWSRFSSPDVLTANKVLI